MLTKEFVLAGKALFTVSNSSGTHYTFSVRKKDGDDRWPATWFVKLLTGPQNTDPSCYTYMGLLISDTGKVILTKNSRYTDDTVPVKVIRWALSHVWAGRQLPEGYRIQHEGRCGRCGRVLTTPESLDSGLGPICDGRMAA